MPKAKDSIYLSHESALRYWRVEGIRGAHRAIDGRTFKAAGRPSVYQIKDALWLRPHLGEPVHLLFPNPDVRPRSKEVVAHCTSSLRGAGSLIEVSAGIGVVSPEICLIQIAERGMLPFLKAAYELCGTYRIARITDLDTRGAVYQQEPLTNPAQIAKTLSANSQLAGSVAARSALKYLEAGSGSPRETALALLLGLPRVHGGYGFKVPKLNYPIKVSSVGRRICGKSRLVLDLYWPEAKLCLEYDSEEFHSTRERHSADAQRRNVLQSMGIRVIEVTAGQLGSVTKTDALALNVAKALGKRKRVYRLKGPDRKIALRDELLKLAAF